MTHHFVKVGAYLFLKAEHKGNYELPYFTWELLKLNLNNNRNFYSTLIFQV